MNIKKITYLDKENFKVDSTIPINKKISANDMNEIKTVINDNADELDLKANAADIYTKQEVDASLDLKADVGSVYTKQEVDASLDLKADVVSVYTKQEVDDSLDLKADAAIVYTKQEVNSELSKKQDTLEAGTNITIVGNVISSTGGSGGASAWGDITGNIEDQLDLKAILDDKEQSLVEGNNIVLTPQGTNNTFINTTDRLTIEGIIGKNGVLDIESETHCKNTVHFESAFVIEDTVNSHSTTIEQLDTDLKIVNTNGDIDLIDKVGIINPRTLKTTQDLLISELKKFKPFTYKGEYDAATTYKQQDCVSVTTGKNVETYISLVDNNLGNNPSDSPTQWKLFSDIVDLEDYYNKTQVDDIITRETQLLDARVDFIVKDHNLEIDPLTNGQWELKLLQSEIDPSDVTKGTVKIVPTDMSSYDIDHVKQSVETINTTIKELTTENEAYTLFRTFQGVESKGSENTEGYSFYGYIPSMGTIPLAKQVGVITFGNIFDCDFTEYDGIFYNDVKIPWGSSGQGITTTSTTFTSTNKHTSITLYKEKTRPSNNLNVDTLVSSYNVVWDSKTEAVSAGTNLKTLITAEEWAKILTGEYFIKAYTTAGAGDTSYQVDFEIQNVVSENREWNIDGGFRKPFGRIDGSFTTCYGSVKVNKNNGEVRFFVIFGDGLNINFDIRKIFIYKRAI